ncbi:MAG: DUF885 family protein [Candidatus Aminicenantes bacterium]|nr:DUF885 family protein [Candidatus Aminicenantes bacterium]
MKRKLIVPLALAAFVLLGFGMLQSFQSAEDAKFTKLVDSYLDEYWKFYPSAATLAGFAKYNDKLEDFSEKNVEKRLDAIDKVNAELVNKLSRDKLSPEVQRDFDVFRNLLDLDQLRLEKMAPQILNPIFYNDVILKSVQGLLAGGAAPLDARVKSATARLEDLPGFLKQAKENLTTPAPEYTNEAIRQFDGILEFYNTEAAQLAGGAPADVKAKFDAALGKARPALEDYKQYLSGTLLAKSTGSFRLGEAHQRFLQLTTLGNIPLNDLVARAQADWKNIRREMLLISAQFYKIMDPKFNVETVQNVTEDQLTNNVVPHVFERINTNRPTKAEFFDKIKAAAAEIEAFINKTKIIEFPATPLTLETMPALERNQMLVSLMSPTPYGQGDSFKVQYNPILDTMTDEQASEFLTEYNSYFLKMWTFINVFPGSLVPAAATHANAGLLRKLIPNKALTQGWPVYAADLMIPSGFGDYDLKLLLNHLKMKLRPSVDFIVEIQTHENNLTKEQAIRLMTVTGFRTPVEAERTWNYIAIHPFESMYSYIGYQEILDIEAEYKKLKGEAFSPKEFLQKLLSFGLPTFRNLKALVLQ